MTQPKKTQIVTAASLVAAAVAFATPATAEMLLLQSDFICEFQTECFEAEPCAETNFSLSFSAPRPASGEDHIAEDVTIETDAETWTGQFMTRANGYVFRGESGGAVHMLSFDFFGEARLATHILENAMSMSYAGICSGQ